MAAVLKTVTPQGVVGSNPTPSAKIMLVPKTHVRCNHCHNDSNIPWFKWSEVCSYCLESDWEIIVTVEQQEENIRRFLESL